MTFSLGLIRDDGRHPRQPFANLRARLGVKPRGFADLEPYSPKVLDQNRIGSCVANGVPCAAATTLAAAGTPLPWVPSVREGYAMDLGIDRAHDNPLLDAMHLPPLRDQGTMLLTGVKTLRDWGVVAMGPNVVVDGVAVESDCGPSNWHKEPDLVTFEKASRNLIVGAYEVLWSVDMETQVQLALDGGFAVALGNFVDVRHFMDYTGTSAPIGAQDFTDPNGGGHCTYLTGYKTDAAGVTVYDGTNSWGTVWGRFGRYRALGSFLRQAWEIMIMDVRLKE